MKAHVCFGRFQPPHIGHIRLFRQMSEDGKADCLIYPSHSFGGGKNPLSYSERVKLLKTCVKNALLDSETTVVESDATDIIAVLKDVEARGYKNVVWYTGSDRKADIDRIITYYNGKEFNFENITYKSLVRKETCNGAEEDAMSGTIIRNYMRNGETHAAFLATPSGVNYKTFQNLYKVLGK